MFSPRFIPTIGFGIFRLQTPDSSVGYLKRDDISFQRAVLLSDALDLPDLKRCRMPQAGSALTSKTIDGVANDG